MEAMAFLLIWQSGTDVEDSLRRRHPLHRVVFFGKGIVHEEE